MGKSSTAKSTKSLRLPKTFGGLKPNPDNPRAIDGRELEALGYSMGEFGDISGIVYNVRTRRLVCGHQRRKHIPLSAQIVGVVPAPADDQGTVGHGWITWALKHGGKDRRARYRLRVVDWPDEKERAASVAANSVHLTGRFNPSIDSFLDPVKTNLPDAFGSLRFDFLVTPNFQPTNGDDQSSLDKKSAVECPECGHEFVP